MLDLAIDNRIFLDSLLDAAVQELDLLFNTENTELLGNVNFGMNFEPYLWMLTPAVSDMREYINTKLKQTLYVSQCKYTVDINFYEGDYRSIYLVQITLTDTSGETVTRKYNFK